MFYMFFPDSLIRCILDGEMLVWDTTNDRFAEFGSNQEIGKSLYFSLWIMLHVLFNNLTLFIISQGSKGGTCK